MNDMESHGRYEFRVEGQVSDVELAALVGLTHSSHAADAVFTADVTDGTQLLDIIARFEGLGLELSEVRQVPHQSSPGVGVLR